MIGQLLLSIIMKKARLFAGPSCKHIHLLMGILGILKSQSTFFSCLLVSITYWESVPYKKSRDWGAFHISPRSSININRTGTANRDICPDMASVSDGGPVDTCHILDHYAKEIISCPS